MFRLWVSDNKTSFQTFRGVTPYRPVIQVWCGVKVFSGQKWSCWHVTQPFGNLCMPDSMSWAHSAWAAKLHQRECNVCPSRESCSTRLGYQSLPFVQEVQHQMCSDDGCPYPFAAAHKETHPIILMTTPIRIVSLQ